MARSIFGNQDLGDNTGQRKQSSSDKRNLPRPAADIPPHEPTEGKFSAFVELPVSPSQRVQYTGLQSHDPHHCPCDPMARRVHVEVRHQFLNPISNTLSILAILRRLRSEPSVDNLGPLNAHPGGIWIVHLGYPRCPLTHDLQKHPSHHTYIHTLQLGCTAAPRASL